MNNWRIIPLQEFDGFTNMAIDEVLSTSIANGGPPTIRFYSWKPSAVSIGYFQAINDEVNLDGCKSNLVDVVRRRTGGGAVYHDQFGEITYSVIGKQELFPCDIIASYKLICSWIIDSLGLLDIPAEFKPINDIITNGKKISGNAQTRRNGVLLQHGTILHSVDVDKMFSLLKVSDEKIKDKIIANVKERVTSVVQQKEISRGALYQALLDGFTKDKDYITNQLSDSELSTAKELAISRYATKEWNFMR